ncbi:MAG: hypothetical protein QOF44_4970, partial [Streptomyces sp.]|nr:hypothetical protein [Streptomyces sp.]
MALAWWRCRRSTTLPQAFGLVEAAEEHLLGGLLACPAIKDNAPDRRGQEHQAEQDGDGLRHAVRDRLPT